MFKSKFANFTVFFILLIGTLLLGYFENGYHWAWIPTSILAYILLLALGSFFIRWNFYLTSINRIPLMQMKFVNQKFQIQQRNLQIILSFDDGPHDNTATVLDILAKEKIKAQFFLIGKNIEGREDIVKRMHTEGHQIGNHSFEHGNNFDWKSTNAIVEEIVTTNEIIENITGEQVRFFRPPYGVTTPNIAKALEITTMNSVGWTVRSLDTTAKDEEKLIAKIVTETVPGAIILLHDRCDITIKILPKLIVQLRQKGFEFSIL